MPASVGLIELRQVSDQAAENGLKVRPRRCGRRGQWRTMGVHQSLVALHQHAPGSAFATVQRAARAASDSSSSGSVAPDSSIAGHLAKA